MASPDRGGADKTGYLSIDAVVNVNSFIGVNEVSGGQVVRYFDFGDYEYWSTVYPSGLEAELLTFVPRYGGANWFAEAAEHARGVVWFLHNWEIPE
jgi:hypothetical protein